jgi:hypothetical protein
MITRPRPTAKASKVFWSKPGLMSLRGARAFSSPAPAAWHASSSTTSLSDLMLEINDQCAAPLEVIWHGTPPRSRNCPTSTRRETSPRDGRIELERDST